MLGRRWGIGLTVVGLVTVLRAAQLALFASGPIESNATHSPEPPPVVRGASASAEPPPADPHSELALLYMACPASATVDWSDVVECAAHQSRGMSHSVAQHPTGHGAAGSSAWARRSPQGVPRVAYPSPVRLPQTDQHTPAPKARVIRIAAADSDQWLVDPKEWYLKDKPPGQGKGAKENPDDKPAGAPDSTAPDGGQGDSGGERARSDGTRRSGSAKSLFAPPPKPPSRTPAPKTDKKAGTLPADQEEEPQDPHLELFARNCYPSARECGKCHEKIYKEWSTSSHAYAVISPMFQKFEQKITTLSKGTVGYFCYRCHSPVGTTMCVSRTTPLWELPEVAREGVTCIACHRVKYRYGKSNGERRIEPGPIFAPVYGGIGGHGVAEVIEDKEKYKVKTSAEEKGPGQDIHLEGIYFDQLSKSEFCASCHQVAVHPGIKLEVVWEQYRASPACKKGIRCQDCHMGRIPGIPSGFEFGPAAEVGGKYVDEKRKHSNHIFYGPGYSIAHPGVFPFHKDADRWRMDEWLQFDWRAGWGTDEFEDKIADKKISVEFPEVWKEVDDRYDARDIIADNLKRLAQKREIRKQIMENGSHVDGPFFKSTPTRGKDLRFHFIVTNTNDGHNLLTASLGAQPQLWANIVLIGPDGRRLWETGYTDQYGDVADIHSYGVRQGIVPFDWQLFNLQTMFLITGAKGTDREFYLPVNVDIDQLPFLRPGVQPITTINHPPFIRMESRSLAPLGSRKVPYRVPGKLICQPGVYRLSFRMRSRAEPIYFMRFVGATVEMQRAMNEGMIDVHPFSVEFQVR